MNLARTGLCSVLAAALTVPAAAADYAWSGFGTVGAARSNSDYVYERFASRTTSFRRDSILGLQGSVAFNPHFSLTVQTIVEPSARDDRKTALTLPWAFVSCQPCNDLLLRAGNMRMPLYLYSESQNIGVSYAFMHLPTEVYSTAPTDDFTGAACSKTCEWAGGDLVLDGFAGISKADVRLIQNVTGGAVRSKLGGLMLALHRQDDTFRAGILHAGISTSTTFAATPSGGGPDPNPDPGGAGGAPPHNMGGMPPVGSGTANTFVYLLGADLDLGHGFRLISEYARRDASNVQFSKNSTGGYLSLQKKLEAWTPYATLGRLLSDRPERQDPDGRHFYDDQFSLALGVAYALSPTSKCKFEWMQVKVLGGSTLFDPSPGGTGISRQDVDLVSASYSCAF